MKQTGKIRFRLAHIFRPDQAHQCILPSVRGGFAFPCLSAACGGRRSHIPLGRRGRVGWTPFRALRMPDRNGTAGSEGSWRRRRHAKIGGRALPACLRGASRWNGGTAAAIRKGRRMSGAALKGSRRFLHAVAAETGVFILGAAAGPVAAAKKQAKNHCTPAAIEPGHVAPQVQ